ncbi:MAG: hypothetical protein GY697_08280 [Desulfobacterales bacterium]|nr:hypothetical protein [Desulfobacterales bacterium]
MSTHRSGNQTRLSYDTAKIHLDRPWLSC